MVDRVVERRVFTINQKAATLQNTNFLTLFSVLLFLSAFFLFPLDIDEYSARPEIYVG